MGPKKGMPERVSAAEQPAAAAYVASEMALLRWVGKPVIVLLNQLGVPRESALEQAEVQRWRRTAGAVETDWVNEVKAKGIDGAKLASEARALIAKYNK